MSHFTLFFQFLKEFRLLQKGPLAILLLGGACMSFLELFGASLLVPMMSILCHPEQMPTHPTVRLFQAFLKLSDPRMLTFVLGSLLAGIFILKGCLHILYLRFEFKILTRWRIQVSDIMFSGYLRAPYETHLQQETPQLIHVTAHNPSHAVNSFIHQMLTLFALVLTGVLIFGFVLYQYPELFLFVLAFGGALLWAQSTFLNRKMRKCGQQLQSLKEKLQAVLQQSFAGHKDMHMHLKLSYFEKKFQSVNSRLSTIEETACFYRLLPSVSIELMVMLIVLCVFEGTLLVSKDPSAALIKMGALVFIVLRMTPLVNRSITSLASLNAGKHATEKLLEEARALAKNASYPPKGPEAEMTLSFQREIALEEACYAYPQAQSTLFQNFSLTIERGEFIGLTGPSGGGKTTLVNMLLGFLVPQQGFLRVDETVITPHNIDALRRMVGYVDQRIFLMSGSIAENVDFGVEQEEIDRTKVKEALQKAQLWDFVTKLPEQEKTEIGENGKFLSGGQQQRLAIARAFYKDLKLLILDEASAALDVETERNLFDFLYSLKGELTVLMIAHRLTTLRHCDRVLFLERGQLIGEGNFETLKKTCPPFRNYLAYCHLERGS